MYKFLFICSLLVLNTFGEAMYIVPANEGDTGAFKDDDGNWWKDVSSSGTQEVSVHSSEWYEDEESAEIKAESKFKIGERDVDIKIDRFATVESISQDVKTQIGAGWASGYAAAVEALAKALIAERETKVLTRYVNNLATAMTSMQAANLGVTKTARTITYGGATYPAYVVSNLPDNNLALNRKIVQIIESRNDYASTGISTEEGAVTTTVDLLKNATEVYSSSSSGKSIEADTHSIDIDKIKGTNTAHLVGFYSLKDTGEIDWEKPDETYIQKYDLSALSKTDKKKPSAMLDSYLLIRSAAGYIGYIPMTNNVTGAEPDDKSLSTVDPDKPTEVTNTVLQIYGFSTATNVKEAAAFSDQLFGTASSSYMLPVKDTQSGILSWLSIGTYKIEEENTGLTTSITTNDVQNIIRRLELANWSDVTNAISAHTPSSSIGDMLTEVDAETTTNLLILAKDLSTSTLQYIKLGGLRTDNVTLTLTNTYAYIEGELVVTNALTIKGFDAAEENAIPIKLKKNEQAEGETEYELGWTNVMFRNGDNVSIEARTLRPSSSETNTVYMANGFITKEPEDEKFSDIVFGDENGKAVAEGKYHVLVRRMEEDAEYNENETNGFSLVYLDLENGESNIFSKLRKSMRDLTNELFKAGGFTNKFDTLTNKLFEAINASNALDNASIWLNTRTQVEIKGFDLADNGSVPVKVGDPTNASRIVWKPYNNARNGCFELDSNGRYINPYFSVGGRVYDAGNGQITAGKINCLCISINGWSPGSSYTTYDTFQEMETDMFDRTKYIIPLYTAGTNTVGGGIEIECDWRTCPAAVMGEFSL